MASKKEKPLPTIIQVVRARLEQVISSYRGGDMANTAGYAGDLARAALEMVELFRFEQGVRGGRAVLESEMIARALSKRKKAKRS